MPTELELLDQQYGPASTVCEYPLGWPYDNYLKAADQQEHLDRLQREKENQQFP